MAFRVVYIGLGSNEGDSNAYLKQAVEEINSQIGKVLRQSSCYETEPWGFHSEHYFINQVIEVETPLSTRKLVESLLELEKQMGRSRSIPAEGEIYTSRIIDMDLLVDGEIMYNLPELTVPHARLADRKFVLVPLTELSPNLVPPGLKGKNVSQLLESCSDKTQVRILP